MPGCITVTVVTVLPTGLLHCCRSCIKAQHPQKRIEQKSAQQFGAMWCLFRILDLIQHQTHKFTPGMKNKILPHNVPQHPSQPVPDSDAFRPNVMQGQ